MHQNREKAKMVKIVSPPLTPSLDFDQNFSKKHTKTTLKNQKHTRKTNASRNSHKQTRFHAKKREKQQKNEYLPQK